MGNCWLKKEGLSVEDLSEANGCTNVAYNPTEKEGPREPTPPNSYVPSPASPDPVTSELVALFDHKATAEDDLSFSKGDMFVLLSASKNDNWFFVRTKAGERRGFVPRNRLAIRGSLQGKQWYHGNISAREAMILLRRKQPQEEGDFLIRDSERRQGQYALTLLCKDGDELTPKQYRIWKNAASRFYIKAESTFSQLQDLVDHVTITKDGICCALKSPCPRLVPPLPDLSSKWTHLFEIPRPSISLGKKLGSGNFGTVYLGFWEHTTEVAVKEAKKGSIDQEAFLKEAKAQNALIHPNIVRLYGVCSDEPMYIVTELMSGGSLLDFLRDVAGPGPRLPPEDLVDMGIQVADGMAYIENRELIHRDLAARNILVGETMNVKIADFGLARAITDSEYIAGESSTFPIKWTAPEGISHRRFTIKSDVWSFGIFLLELITHGAVPYQGLTNFEVVKNLERRQWHPQPQECPDELYDEMTSCWQWKADDRPTFQQLVANLESTKAIIERRTAGRETCRVPCATRSPDISIPQIVDVGDVHLAYEQPETSSIEDSPDIGDEPETDSVKQEPAPATSSDSRVMRERQTSSASHSTLVVVALFDFESTTSEDLSFKKGDKFVVLGKGNWLHVKEPTTGQTGYIPANYTAEEDTCDTYPWFQPEVSKTEEKHLLPVESNEEGTFLIRKATAELPETPFVLSVLCRGFIKSLVKKSYRIVFYNDQYSLVNSETTFQYLHELVAYYSEHDDFGFLLKHPCRRTRPVLLDLSSQTQHSYEIPRQSLDKGQKLGQCSVGEVWKGHWNGSVEVAIKSLQPGAVPQVSLLQELTAIKMLQHNNLVRLFGVCSDEPMLIVTELLEYGDLRSYLRQDQYHSIATEDLLAMALQVARGMEYLESQSVMHRDLATRNIYVGRDQVVKIDIDLARLAARKTTHFKWTAWEGLLGKELTTKSDVWSFGIVLVEITTHGAEPYPAAKSKQELIDQLRAGKRHSRPQECPEELYLIMEECWEEDPADRPSFSDLAESVATILMMKENYTD